MIISIIILTISYFVYISSPTDINTHEIDNISSKNGSQNDVPDGCKYYIKPKKYNSILYEIYLKRVYINSMNLKFNSISIFNCII